MDQCNSRPIRLQRIVEDNDLEEFSWANRRWPDDEALGLLQLDSRSLRLQGAVFDKFLREWLVEFVANDPCLDQELEELMSKVFSEKAASLTRFLIRKHLQGETPISLTTLVEQVADPAKQSFRTTCNRLIKDLQDPMTFTKVWEVEIVYRTVKGREEIGGYKISAGQALIDWEEFVWRPMRQAQLKQFFTKYGNAS